MPTRAGTTNLAQAGPGEGGKLFAPAASWRPFLAAVAAVAFIVLCGDMIALDRSPLAWSDEVTLDDAGRELVQNGDFRSRVFSDKPAFDHNYLWQPPGQVLTAALSYRLFGFGIWQTRLPAVIFAAGSVIMLAFLTLALTGDRRAALLASIFWGLYPGFLRSARGGRPDPQYFFFAFLSIFLAILSGKAATARGRSWLAVGGGLAMGLAGMTHPIAVFWTFAAFIIIVLDGRSSRLARAFLFAVGAAIPLCCWIAYGMHDWPHFHEQFFKHAASKMVSGSVAARTFAEFSAMSNPAMYPAYAVFLISVPYLLVRARVSRQARVALPIFLILFFAPNPFLKLEVSSFYFLHPMVVLCITAAIMASDVIGRANSGSTWHRVAVAATALVIADLFFAGFVLRSASVIGEWNVRDYRNVDEGIARFIPPGAPVAGDPAVWYAVYHNGDTLESMNVVAPDPRLVRFVVRPAPLAGDDTPPPGFRRVGQFGQRKPPELHGHGLAYTAAHAPLSWAALYWVGRLETEDYVMNVFERDPGGT